MKYDLRKVIFYQPNGIRDDGVYLVVEAEGRRVQVSPAFRRRTAGKRFRLGYYPDASVLFMLPDQEPQQSIYVPKSGCIKRTADFYKMLVDQGRPLPARYDFHWEEEQQVWVGELNKKLSGKRQAVAPG